MPELPVPPTPPVPLAALLAREDLALRQITGPSGPGVVIHSAHTSEMADPYPYLLGGELLLTAGVHIPQAAGSEEYFDGYVARIVEAGGAALGFGVAPVHDTVPRALVAACERRGFPLVEVAPSTTFAAVARAVWELMARARVAELRRVTEAQQSLAAAASRPDPVPSVLHRLSRRLEGWAVLYGPEGTEIAESGHRPPDQVTRSLAALTRVVRPTPTTVRPGTPGSTTTPGRPGTLVGTTPSIRPGTPEAPAGPARPGTPAASPGAGRAGMPGGTTSLGRPGTPGGTTPPARPGPPGGTAPPAQPASATDVISGSHLAAYALGAGRGFVLGVAGPRREPGDHTIVSVAAVLLSLLTGEHQSGTGAARVSALVRVLLGAPASEVAPLLGEGPWLVVHGHRDGQPGPDQVAVAALAAALGSALVDGGPDVVRVLVPGEREPAVQDGWTLGVSAPAGPDGWADADAQAARALARARATRTPLVRHGAAAGFAELVSADAARAHARALLAPLAGSPALTDTLRAWLSLHGSWDRTAVALAVHRNTVRQRIARCAASLGVDLDDPDVRMELWFALRRGE